MLSLLWVYIIIFSYFCCLSPHGESGLKWALLLRKVTNLRSLPAWGEWIEIYQASVRRGSVRSLPAWGEWIEIFVMQSYQGFEGVSPRMGRVD